ncbi:hypothetical protein SH501x_001056 [Pirellulaceae bacterium SH501]
MRSYIQHACGFVFASCLSIQACFGQVPANPRISLHSEKWNEIIETENIEACLRHFEAATKAAPQMEPPRALLGITRFLRAVENLGKTWYRFGVRQETIMQSVPFFRLPVPTNPDPELVTYHKVRAALDDFANEVRVAQESLVQPKDPHFKLLLRLGKVQFDWNDDGKRGSAESFKAMLQGVSPAAMRNLGDDIEVGIDHADIAWLRGYCHVLLSMSEIILAHDESELFNRCGHLLFTNVDSPFLLTRHSHGGRGFDMEFISDLIASIHLVRFPCKEPERMKKAHAHMLAMVEESRGFWQLAMAETDNEREWIPNPKQTGILQVPVNQELVVGWLSVLDELESILQGEKLVPYWRIYNQKPGNPGPIIPDEGTGINVRRVFMEPQEFDLVLAVQGSSWEAYLEDGKLSTPQAWEQLTRVFGGRFFGFAAWFN